MNEIEKKHPCEGCNWRYSDNLCDYWEVINMDEICEQYEMTVGSKFDGKGA